MTESKWYAQNSKVYGLCVRTRERTYEPMRAKGEPAHREDGYVATQLRYRKEATLIAQAPALYEALEELLADFIGHHPDNGDRFCKMCHAICDPDDRIPFEHREFTSCYRSSAVLATARGEA